MLSLLLQAAAYLRQTRHDERGQGLTEYALLLVGIAAIVVLAVAALQLGILDIISDIFPASE